jgi:TPR repeat protein
VQDNALSLELARASAGRGSKHGQYALGWLLQRAGGGVAVDSTQALAFYRPAAAQGLDEAPNPKPLPRHQRAALRQVFRSPNVYLFQRDQNVMYDRMIHISMDLPTEPETLTKQKRS